MFTRMLDLPVGKHSFFLFGPRQTGKTTLVLRALGERPRFHLDLLDTASFLQYSRDPALFRREVEFWAQQHSGGIVFVDEIQKMPLLLDAIQALIDKYRGRLTFIMTGSSARKLKRASTNLLAGRAWAFHLYPLTHRELEDQFDLNAVLQYGALPPIIGLDAISKQRTLKAYTQTYLKEEILQEALVRNVPAFGHFLELAADQSGALVNYSNFAAETGVASKTIRDYYQVLEDTLVALPLHPYLKSARKRLTTHPVYYLFDLGVMNALCARLENSPLAGSILYGRLFEHFIILEMRRLLNYAEKEWPMHYWRTAHGAEVDVILEKDRERVAIEIKSSERPQAGDMKGLHQFLEDYSGFRGVCVCNAQRPYRLGKVVCLPWRTFFKELI